MTLKKLRILADQNRSQATYQDMTINFKPEWFWDLLVPSIHETNDSLGVNSMAESGSDSTSKMRLKSHFIDRLPEDFDSDREQDHPESAPFSLDSFPIGLEDLEQFHIEELSRDFLESDFWDMVN
jgi:hypothetical protein